MIGNAATPQPQVPVSPVPTIFSVGQGTGPDGHPWVLLFCDTPLGRQVFHLTPANAKALGAAMEKLGAAGPLILSAGNGHDPTITGGGETP